MHVMIGSSPTNVSNDVECLIPLCAADDGSCDFVMVIFNRCNYILMLFMLNISQDTETDNGRHNLYSFNLANFL